MSLKKYNKTGINWGIETDGFAYVKLAELEEGKIYPLRGMFVTPDNGFGEGAVLITDSCMVNIPQRYVQMINEIRASKEDVEEIIAGKCGFHYETFTSKYGTPGYTIAFDDLA